MRTLITSDIHGQLKALKQVLELASFDPSSDLLICLGDYVDRGNEITETIEFLSTIPNGVFLLGNHDEWCLTYLRCRLGHTKVGLGFQEYLSWKTQGGQQTIESMEKNDSFELVYQFLNSTVPFYKQDHKLFVHGGIHPSLKVEEMNVDDIIWDRQLIAEARIKALDVDNPVCINYDEVYVGHTPLFNYNRYEPTQWSNVIAVDCGACYPNNGGRLGLIDIKSKQTWVSDKISDLYSRNQMD